MYSAPKCIDLSLPVNKQCCKFWDVLKRKLLFPSNYHGDRNPKYLEDFGKNKTPEGDFVIDFLEGKEHLNCARSANIFRTLFKLFRCEATSLCFLGYGF